MAERLTGARLVCALTAAATSHACAAQTSLPDPTRPPAALSAEAAAKPGAGQASKSAHRVQTVLISPERKLAVIDGRTVPLGGRIDDALVIAITETGVTLRRGAQTETLPLNAGVQKKQVAP